MKHFLLACMLLLCVQPCLQAQLTVQTPIVNTGASAITDTIYMAPDGNDANPGTEASLSVASHALLT